MTDNKIKDMLNEIITFGETHSNFRALDTFIGIQDWYNKKNKFTTKQIAAIEGVHNKWKLGTAREPYMDNYKNILKCLV